MRALLEEGPHGFLGVGGLAGGRHRLGGEGVGLGLIEVDLGVEGLLAEPLGQGAASGRTHQQIGDGIVELGIGHRPVDEPPVGRRRGVDHVTGQRHLQRPLATDASYDGHQRRVAEEATLPPGDGEAGAVGRHRQVTAGHQLATGRRGQGVDAGDDRLRDGLDRLHHLAAGAEEVTGGSEVGAGHIGEVVAGRERRSGGGQHHPPGVAATGVVEGGGEVVDHAQLEGVASTGVVEGDGDDVTGAIDPNGLGGHGVTVAIGPAVVKGTH